MSVPMKQGGEAPTIIFSGTVSDPAAMAANAAFYTNVNRSNVAFSRPMRRLIVVCSRTLIDFMPASYAQYESMMLWKGLREMCCLSGGVDTGGVAPGHRVELWAAPC